MSDELMRTAIERGALAKSFAQLLRAANELGFDDAMVRRRTVPGQPSLWTFEASNPSLRGRQLRYAQAVHDFENTNFDVEEAFSMACHETLIRAVEEALSQVADQERERDPSAV